MKMIGRLGRVLLRGAVTVIIVPMLFAILKGFLAQNVVLSMVAGEDKMFGFILLTAMPIVYLVCALIYTFYPLFEPEKTENNMTDYIKNSNLWRR